MSKRMTAIEKKLLRALPWFTREHIHLMKTGLAAAKKYVDELNEKSKLSRKEQRKLVLLLDYIKSCKKVLRTYLKQKTKGA